jgi:hypothetical protein
MENNESALKKQVGGNHYKKLAIQPMEYAMKNHLDPLQFSIIKYVTRFRDKDGKIDLKKAQHCLDMLIELEYGKQTESNELQPMSELPNEWQKLFLYTKKGECKLGLRYGRLYYVSEINKQEESISSAILIMDGENFVGWKYVDTK